ACTDLRKMLGFLADKARARKLRLFACACLRRRWDSLPCPWSRAALETSERYADGLASRKKLRKARLEAQESAISGSTTASVWPKDAKAAARDAVTIAASDLGSVYDIARLGSFRDEDAKTALLHDIF